MTKLHDRRFPNESVSYRSARNRLLRAELALRRQIEKVAAMRRELPAGGAVLETLGQGVRPLAGAIAVGGATAAVAIWMS